MIFSQSPKFNFGDFFIAEIHHLPNNLKMKLKQLLVLHLLLLICSAGCVNPKTEETWEGISDNNLKVIISEFFPFEENTAADYITNRIKEKLDQRASLIIASHISVKLSRDKISHEVDVTLNKLINDTISGGKLVDFNCDENNYCSAHGVYDIAELQKNLELINNR